MYIVLCSAFNFRLFSFIVCMIWLVPRRLCAEKKNGRVREKGDAKEGETSGRLCFQDGGVLNGG